MCLLFTGKFRIPDHPDIVDDVTNAFKKYAEGESQMSPEQLRAFMEAQGDGGATLEKAKENIEKVLGGKQNAENPTERNLTIKDFNDFLFSADLNPPIGNQVHHDMDAPLSHYFIFTGHNSYLTGNQLSSKCSDLPIVNALAQGVKVIELDLWPHGGLIGKIDVRVKHGGTMTRPVKLGKCLESIKANAFKKSDYPVIITLEDHLTPELRTKVAEMIKNTFGEKLYQRDSKSCEEFPSPEKLKGMVLISTKPPTESDEAKDGNGKKGRGSGDDVWGEEPAELISSPSDLNEIPDTINYESPDEEEEGVCDSDKLCPEQESAYKNLIAIHAGKPKGKGLPMALKVDPNEIRRLSLSEQQLEKAAATCGADVIRFTQQNFLRIYPKGTRFTSSNYKPQIGWMHGAQMIAFNMQGYGRALWLMQGMFRANGGCGYVKKPDFLMNVGPEGQVFDPKGHLPTKKTLTVKVLTGFGWHLDFKTAFDLFSLPDFYVKVGIAGAPADEPQEDCDPKNKKPMKETKVRDNTWTPVWNEEFTFQLKVPELALLRVEVHEDDNGNDDFGGQTCLPVSELRQGIRAVTLFNRKGEMYPNTRLLMSFKLSEPPPS